MRHMSGGGLGRLRLRLSVGSRLAGSCWDQIQGALFAGQGEPAAQLGVHRVGQTGGGVGGCPLAHSTGTCGVRGPSSIRLQLVTGLCPPCPLGLQGRGPASGVQGP